MSQWKTQVMVEDDHDPMVDRKPPEALLQLVAIDDHLDVVAGGRLGVADLTIVSNVAETPPLDGCLTRMRYSQPTRHRCRGAWAGGSIGQGLLDSILGRSGSRRTSRATATRRSTSAAPSWPNASRRSCPLTGSLRISTAALWPGDRPAAHRKTRVGGWSSICRPGVARTVLIEKADPRCATTTAQLDSGSIIGGSCIWIRQDNQGRSGRRRSAGARVGSRLRSRTRDPLTRGRRDRAGRGPPTTRSPIRRRRRSG